MCKTMNLNNFLLQFTLILSSLVNLAHFKGGKGGVSRGGIRPGARGSFSGRAASSRDGSFSGGNSRSRNIG